eukprot:SAG25_NODE_560_length_6917_cov_7.195365_1_plen_189_part_00
MPSTPVAAAAPDPRVGQLIQLVENLASNHELLGISDPFGSSLLPANRAGASSSGSFRPVAVHGNNPTRPPFCPHSNARRLEAAFRWSPTHFRYVDCGATVGVARQSRRLLVNSHLGANDVLIVLSANRVLINRSCVLAIIILICFFLSASGGGMIHAAAHPSGSFSPELLKFPRSPTPTTQAQAAETF